MSDDPTGSKDIDIDNSEHSEISKLYWLQVMLYMHDQQDIGRLSAQKYY